MIFSSVLMMMLLIISTFGEDCDDILCANVLDNVCGMAELRDGTQIIMKYTNICYMRKKACEMKSVLEIYQIADEFCNIKKEERVPMRHNIDGRRVYDFTIVGAHQACNHTCPIYCTDVYEPACAQIWMSNMMASTFRPMINHCHIDLFSCVAGVNVTIQPLAKCYKNPSGLLFMQHVASMKSLHLLDDDLISSGHVHLPKPKPKRRTNDLPEWHKQRILKEHLRDTLSRIFSKDRNVALEIQLHEIDMTDVHLPKPKPKRRINDLPEWHK